MADSQLLGILLIAMVAGIILFRLYTVLGRRTGNEREPQQRFGRIGGAVRSAAGKVLALPDRTSGPVEQQAQSDDPAAQGLLDIKLADRSFDTAHFLEGARHAYQMIVVAFAAHDRTTLRPLLSDEVYSAFDGVMRQGEERHETVNYSFVGFRNVRITHAELKDRTADITVEFSAQFTSATTDANGAVVEGDPKSVRDVVDVWSFARDTRANDPNWTLVATSSGG
ncbi:MAG TPA: Tim44/TimA family putative adaptor protein [Rhizomicrobium sp.]